jgi:hypothetical protein
MSARNKQQLMCASSWRSACSPLHLFVGKDSRGQWVVRDQQGRRGGIFRNRASALHFAMREMQDAEGTIVVTQALLELFNTSNHNAATGADARMSLSS